MLVLTLFFLPILLWAGVSASHAFKERVAVREAIYKAQDAAILLEYYNLVLFYEHWFAIFLLSDPKRLYPTILILRVPGAFR